MEPFLPERSGNTLSGSFPPCYHSLTVAPFELACGIITLLEFNRLPCCIWEPCQTGSFGSLKNHRVERFVKPEALVHVSQESSVVVGYPVDLVSYP